MIHPRDNDLIAGTHGRGIWILDGISALQQLTPAVLASDVHLFENRVATKWRGISRGATRGHFLFMGRNPPSIQERTPSNNPAELANTASVTFYLKNAPSDSVALEIASMNGQQRFRTRIAAQRGINRYRWNLRFPQEGPQALAAGGERGRGGFAGRGGVGGPEAAAATYRVVLTVAGGSYEGTITVRDDPDTRLLGQ